MVIWYEVIKLERRGHLVWHGLISALFFEQVVLGLSNSEDLGVKSVSEIERNRKESGRRGSPEAHTLVIWSHRL